MLFLHFFSLSVLLSPRCSMFAVFSNYLLKSTGHFIDIAELKEKKKCVWKSRQSKWLFSFSFLPSKIDSGSNFLLREGEKLLLMVPVKWKSFLFSFWTLFRPNDLFSVSSLPHQCLFLHICVHYSLSPVSRSTRCPVRRPLFPRMERSS